ncbi:MAG: lysylphosphatidylglycerol synthase domain-containing protein, partial [Gammaproteobacteria bacterium]
GGDLTKFVKLRARDHAAHTVAGAIVLDHALGATSLIVLAAASWWQLAIPGVPLVSLLGGSLVLAALLAAAGLLLAARWRPTRDLRTLLARARRRWPLLAGALVLSLIMHVTLAAAVWVASRDWGFALDFTRVLAVFSVSALLQAVPVSVLGAGAAELAGTGLYLALGLPGAAALLMTSLFYSYRLIMALLGGLWDVLPEPGRDARRRTPAP